MSLIKPIITAGLFFLSSLTIFAQKQPEAEYIFRFAPGRDTFNVPYGGNGARLDAADPVVVNPQKQSGSFCLRANLLCWATLTPDVGVEWRMNRNVSIVVNGTATSWSWKDGDRRYALWEITPEFRWYLGKQRRGYVGAMYKTGFFNYKLSGTGRQGSMNGYGVTGGYILPLCRSLSMDFTLGIGYIHAHYDRYHLVDGVRKRIGKDRKDWFGPINAGVTLVWNLTDTMKR